MTMGFGSLENSQDRQHQNRIAARGAINLFLWQLHTLWHGEMVKRIYVGIGTQFVGVSAIIAGQKTFNV
jgi:hypothetical protein